MLRQLVNPVRNILRPTKLVPKRNYHAESDIKPPTMDDLPVPSGSWEAQYRSNQAKYNMHLAVGILFTAVTFVTAKASGLLYFNYAPPPLPQDEK